ncbi:hypothetical protein [Cognatishimia sp. F0-27]|uniref:hypothetical protein n=1 Tax=Cognatishimia sp. F0-27 TaxID=2816855 RepID=UPI001D0C3465|nr:hypothetical protein [Cognatishimia sp. F0-27]MCC1492983.1 hypothetical protein [Cognatishimia sp. F0-27]
MTPATHVGQSAACLLAPRFRDDAKGCENTDLLLQLREGFLRFGGVGYDVRRGIGGPAERMPGSLGAAGAERVGRSAAGNRMERFDFCEGTRDRISVGVMRTTKWLRSPGRATLRVADRHIADGALSGDGAVMRKTPGRDAFGSAGRDRQGRDAHGSPAAEGT